MWRVQWVVMTDTVTPENTTAPDPDSFVDAEIVPVADDAAEVLIRDRILNRGVCIHKAILSQNYVCGKTTCEIIERCTPPQSNSGDNWGRCDARCSARPARPRTCRTSPTRTSK